jgi:hypothetical protein
LQLGAREKTAARKIFLLMALDVPQVFCSRQQEDRMLDGFQFEDGQATGARHGQSVQTRMFIRSAGQDLGLRKMWIERRIRAGYILAYKKLQPALGLRSKERMPGVGRQWMTMRPQFPERSFQFPGLARIPFGFCIPRAKIDACLIRATQVRETEQPPPLKNIPRPAQDVARNDR